MISTALSQKWYQKLGIPSEQHWKWTSAILIIFYAVGIVGILGEIHPDFILLTPFNLLLSVFLILAHHQNWSTKFIVWLLFTYIIGFSAEVIGVNTGLIFGDYTYGPVLGWKLMATPLMIGVNWVMLAYSSAVLVQQIFPKVSWIIKAVLAALIMVTLDFIIEPVAIHYDFWQWTHETIPLKNYLGWFFVALIIHLVYFRQFKGVKNNVAIVLFSLQVLFFLILLIFK